MCPPVTHDLKSSDQMPEEAPAEQVPDDVPEAKEGAAREAALRHTEDARRNGRFGIWWASGGYASESGDDGLA
jgi:hypothetical protein